MDKTEGQSKKENDTRQAKKLPAEIVGRFMQKLSVGDRLKSERVSPHWKQALEKWGWTEQKKLDDDIVFEGVNEGQIFQYWEDLDDGSCYLVSLFNRIGQGLRELCLNFFGPDNLVPFLNKIAASILLFPRLERLNIRGFNLRDFIDFLPHTLCELRTTGKINFDTLKTLYDRSPHLEEVPFKDIEVDNYADLNNVVKLIGKFPRQKRLRLFNYYYFPSAEKHGAFASIDKLKELEQLWDSGFLDGESLEAIADECQQLRTLFLETLYLTEEKLFHLAKMPNLTVLEISDENSVFSDSVLESIAQRGQLKKLVVNGIVSEGSITDNSIVYLIDKCKSLVSLGLFGYTKIRERSLKAIVAEVQRRHGAPPRTLPTDPDLDCGIFYFSTWNTGIEWVGAKEMIGDNPWLIFGSDYLRKII